MKKSIDRIPTTSLLPAPTTVCSLPSLFVLGFSPGFSGNIPNLKWSFSLSHTRLLNGGWIREQTVTDLPSCKFHFDLNC